MAAPHVRPQTRSLDLTDEAATETLAARLSGLARRGDVIALFGDLGTGKTTFARAFVNALPRAEGAPRGDEEVPSPTFTLLQIYERRPAPIWHFDLYRVRRPDEAYELGLEEALAEGISLIEWPERLGPLLPAERLEVHLAFGPTAEARTAELVATATWAGRLADLARDA
ncbi:MAG TPA: tRNA (adenosine(37)-N6)-threonylcarbamoyltransferase complex ATPase subunit type 1 TsaE [Kiloniellales bacterium]|nr:tRNA (adenosine(37)-N6)-threonylcarbamoyltransferase complex ATPase subunit type 1 TsaE [Kiloniellales bacterium]